MTTKEQERNILAQIDGLINSTEPGSYIRTAFSGCVQMAENNIRDDFANNYPDMIEYRDAQIETLKKEVADLRHDYKLEEKHNEDLIAQVKSGERAFDTAMANINALMREKEDLETRLARAEEYAKNKDAEIIKLKAKLYDLLCGKEV